MKRHLKKADNHFVQLTSIYPISILPISFYKFFVTGVFAFIVDTTVLNILIYAFFDGSDERLFDTISIPKFLSACAGIAVGFLINRIWAFRHAKSGSAGKQAGKYLMTFAINLGVASVLFPIYKDIYLGIGALDGLKNLAPTTANIATTASIMFISYFSYRFFVFKEEN